MSDSDSSYDLPTFRLERVPTVGDNQDNHKVELGKKSLENQRRQTGQDDFRFVGVPRCGLGAVS